MKLEDIESAAPPRPEDVRIGISDCLLGSQVRFDGGHKNDRFLRGLLEEHVTFVPMCPEVEMGLPVPRETLRLVRSGAQTRLLAPASGTDHTEAMRAWAARRVGEIGRLDLSGFILKSKSPSCGLERVKVYDENGSPSKNGRGLFAEALAADLPRLPLEEEGRLRDPALRENFFERVFAYRRLRQLFSSSWTVADLVAFHTREKLLLLAHDQARYRELGRLVAAAARTEREALAASYEELFLAALARPATRMRHLNVLQHMLGHLREGLPDDDREELRGLIGDYVEGRAPLLVPLTLLRHHVRRLGLAWLGRQSYLDPHPKELMLRTWI